MRTHAKPNDGRSPLDILTELAVEGTSSLVEVQRTLLDLAQQENDIILNGLKKRIGGFLPAVAMTDLVRRSLDALIGMQQELLTSTSKRTLQLLESEKTKGSRAEHLVDFAREGVETFTRAQKKFLDAVAQEAARATHGKHEHAPETAKRTETAHLARDAGNAFIEAQKRLLDVMGQQMNVNLDATARTFELMSPTRLMPMAEATREGVKNFVDAETSLVGSLIRRPKKAIGRARPRRIHARRQHKAVAV